MSKILITGANGFIGANIVRAALEKEYEVKAFVRKTSDLQALKDLPIELAYGDLKDTDSIKNAMDDCEYIIHNGAIYIFSAKWLKGKRAYDLARQGKKVELKPKEIRIENIEMIKYEPTDLTLRIRCSKGTYIRALARDIGKSLGSGGHLTKLRRTAIGKINVDQAWSLTKFEENLKKM